MNIVRRKAHLQGKTLPVFPGRQHKPRESVGAVTSGQPPACIAWSIAVLAYTVVSIMIGHLLSVHGGHFAYRLNRP